MRTEPAVQRRRLTAAERVDAVHTVRAMNQTGDTLDMSIYLVHRCTNAGEWTRLLPCGIDIA